MEDYLHILKKSNENSTSEIINFLIIDPLNIYKKLISESIIFIRQTSKSYSIYYFHENLPDVFTNTNKYDYCSFNRNLNEMINLHFPEIFNSDRSNDLSRLSIGVLSIMMNVSGCFNDEKRKIIISLAKDHIRKTKREIKNHVYNCHSAENNIIEKLKTNLFEVFKYQRNQVAFNLVKLI